MENEGRKKFIRRIGLIAAFATGALLAQPVLAGIATSKHNLGSTQVAPNTRTTAGTDEICVFCHTPHGSNVAAPAPLWNRVTASPPTYALYGSGATNAYGLQSMDSQVVQPGVGSLICLSCHDGTQAMDNVINAPGSGGYNAAGNAIAGTSWAGNATTVPGKLNPGIITNIGMGAVANDLANDHPIGIQYCGGGVNNTTVVASSTAQDVTGGCADSDFYGSTANGTNLKTQLIDSRQVWWVETGANTVRNRTDMILYSRASGDFSAASGTSVPAVECATCHDPHSSNATFLRLSNAGSAVCLSCHVK